MYTKDFIKMEFPMDLENIAGRMAQFIKEILFKA